MKRGTVMIGLATILLLSAGAIAAERWGGHGKHGKGFHGKKTLLGTQLVVENVADGANLTVTASDEDKAEAVKKYFAHMLDRKAKGLGCPQGPGMPSEPRPDGIVPPPFPPHGEMGPCGCGCGCGCKDGQGPCGCGGECGCKDGNGECKCGKGDGACGCGGPGGCMGGPGWCLRGPGGGPKLCGLLSAEDVALAVEEFELGVVLSVTSTNPDEVLEIQGTLAKLAEFINNWKPGQGCGCQGK